MLATGDAIDAYLDSHDTSDLERAIRRAVFVSHNDPDYDQIRYIDQRGQEVFRVNFDGAVVPAGELQNKATRPFFQRANALAPDQVYVSAIDLDVDEGQIARPIKPTLRVAVPLYDSSGAHRGIYVINILVENSFDRLRRFLPLYANRLRILNDQGYWLAGASPADEWGFLLPERSDFTLARTDPELWSTVLQNTSGQRPSRGGYFTWSRAGARAVRAAQALHHRLRRRLGRLRLGHFAGGMERVAGRAAGNLRADRAAAGGADHLRHRVLPGAAPRTDGARPVLQPHARHALRDRLRRPAAARQTRRGRRRSATARTRSSAGR